MIIDLFFYVLFSTTMYIYFSTFLLFEIFNKYQYEFFLSKFTTSIILCVIGFILSLYDFSKIRWTGYLGNIFSLFGALVLMY